MRAERLPVSRPARRRIPVPGATAMIAAGLGAGLAGWWLAARRRPARREPGTHRAARRLNEASALLGLSVMADSGLEHFRGEYHNRAMFAAPSVSGIQIGASALGAVSDPARWSTPHHAVQVASAATGVSGLAFHLWNVLRRPGGLSWQNLFYGAPVGAPFALTLAGTVGAAAEHVRGADPHHTRLLGRPAGPALAAGAAFGLGGTVAEAWLLHLRGAFHNPLMWLPVTVPPVTAALLARAAFVGRGRMPVTRRMLEATAALGFAGSAFHAFGVARNMGGWRNWSQNIQSGPPLPAPPSFTGMALAGLAALEMMEARNARD
ncbi:hypothetical protein [uncultured Jannaschia sp.]|uniref:hypothetical protein n=1 Tax=uncultured Jannaschia sp. TaxID=293347 RepID=UPI00260D1131|nr:hypothetical protein [uncultured Jannaschia sp.]